MCRKDTGTDSKSYLPPSAGFTAEATCCLWNASDIIFKGATNVNPQISFSPKKFPKPRKGGQGKTSGFPRLICLWQIKMFNHFRQDTLQRGLSCPVGAIHLLRLPKIPRPARPESVHTSDRRHWWWGRLRGSLLPLKSSHQTNFAVFIFTPGPMVEAATQLRIYWPLAAAGLALTMAPIRAL